MKRFNPKVLRAFLEDFGVLGKAAATQRESALSLPAVCKDTLASFQVFLPDGKICE